MKQYTLPVSMRALGFTDQVRWLLNTGHQVIPFRRWSCRCKAHSVELHDAVLRFTERQRQQLGRLILCPCSQKENARQAGEESDGRVTGLRQLDTENDSAAGSGEQSGIGGAQ